MGGSNIRDNTILFLFGLSSFRGGSALLEGVIPNYTNKNTTQPSATKDSGNAKANHVLRHICIGYRYFSRLLVSRDTFLEWSIDRWKSTFHKKHTQITQHSPLQIYFSFSGILPKGGTYPLGKNSPHRGAQRRAPPRITKCPGDFFAEGTEVTERMETVAFQSPSEVHPPGVPTISAKKKSHCIPFSWARNCGLRSTNEKN